MAVCISSPREVARGHYLLTLDTQGFKKSIPGQFINVRVNTSTDPLVRRPFSIFSHEDDTIEIIVKVIGRGTGSIVQVRNGETIDILGPLGRGFSLMSRGRALLVGGGVGNAPLCYLSRRLADKKIPFTYLYCCRSSDSIYLRDQFAQAADRFLIATDDGSCGERGRAPEITSRLLKEETFDMIYTCGPTPMMEGVVREAAVTGTPVEVSLENYFGCGIGLCSGCTVETREGNKRACVDGPVLNGSIINWKSITV